MNNGVTSIGLAAFEECQDLATVTIPNTVTNIGQDAFGGCSSLTSITLPGSVTSLAPYTFNACGTSPASISKATRPPPTRLRSWATTV